MGRINGYPRHVRPYDSMLTPYCVLPYTLLTHTRPPPPAPPFSSPPLFQEDVKADRPRARRYYQHALEASPDHVPTLLRLGSLVTRAMENVGPGGGSHPDVSRGRELLSRAVAISPDDADAHFYYAKFLEGPAGLSEAAAHHYQRCVEIDPHHVLALQGLGELRLMQGDENGAEELLLRPLPG